MGAPIDALGMSTPVPLLLLAVILRYCSGYEPMDVPGMRKLVLVLLKAVILRC